MNKKRYRFFKAGKRAALLFLTALVLSGSLTACSSAHGDKSEYTDEGKSTRKAKKTDIESEKKESAKKEFSKKDDSGEKETDKTKDKNKGKKDKDSPSTSAKKASGNWQTTGKTFNDINANKVINHKKGTVWNFSTEAAAGIGGDRALTSEAEYGFTLKILDKDRVEAVFYNNSGKDVSVKKIFAEQYNKDLSSTSKKNKYIINDYSRCPDGLGMVTMDFSTGKTLTLGVIKQGDKLYACNNDSNDTNPLKLSEYRRNLTDFMNQNGISPENSLTLEGINYPIRIKESGEKTDVDYWISFSDTLVEKDWTDAHKVYAIYDYCINNIAYDHWIIGQGNNARCFKYNDYSGKYYTSVTKVGVCQDFANIMAIMCRAQGIPAVRVSSGKHAWNDVYISDYGRWVHFDTTNDCQYNANQEDVTAKTRSGCAPFNNFDRLTGDKKIVSIEMGNPKD